MDLRAHLATLRRSWWLLALPAVAGLVLSLVVLGLQTPKYESTANVYVSVGNAANANDLSQGNSFAQTAAVNFAALAEQPYVLHAVRQKLGLTLTSDQIAREMTTNVEDGTSIISISVLDPSPTRAADIADATATQLSTAVRVLNPTAADGTQSVRVTVVRTANVPATPIVPNRPLGLALGLLGGLLVGVLLIVARELLDTRVRSVEELQQLTGAPTVGQIPRTASIDHRPLVLVDQPGSAAAEGFRLLQLNTEYLRAPRGTAVLGIASAVPSEGKSTVAANLAVALASAGHRVVLVDADLRRPRLHAVFGLDSAVGLTEVLIGRVDVLDAVQAWGSGDVRLAILPAGATPPNPGELLQSPVLADTLRRLADEADVVLVDGPPLLAVADSSVLARTVDAVLLVASMRRSHRASIVRAVEALSGVGATVLGGVATMTKPARSDADAYSRYATDGSGADRRSSRRVPRSGDAEKPRRGGLRRARRDAAVGESALEAPGAIAPTAPVSTALDDLALVARPDAVVEAASATPTDTALGLASEHEAVRTGSAPADADRAPEEPVEDDELTPLPSDAGVIVLDDHRAARRPETEVQAGSNDVALDADLDETVEEPEPEPEPEEPSPAQEPDALEWTALDVEALPEDHAVYFAEDDGTAEQRVVEPQSTAPASARPTRVPSATAADPKTLRALRRRLTPEELRVLRGFETRIAGSR